MLNKKDLSLLCEFIDSGNPKRELDFACVGSGGICATDSLKAIKFHLPDVKCIDLLIHKKLLKGFSNILGKKDFAKIVSDSTIASLEFSSICLNLDSFDYDYTYPNVESILSKDTHAHFSIESLNDIVFELSQRNCFVDMSYISPLIKHGECCTYDVFYTPMKAGDAGIVKIIGSSVRNEEEGITPLYTAVLMCREFVSQAKD